MSGPSYTVISKRGYLVNTMTDPPLIYEFQYNPTRLTDSKNITWGKREPVGDSPKLSRSNTTKFEQMGRAFSNADFHKFDSEGDRTLTFKLTIDGRERRDHEPQNRRNSDGDILADLALLRSFVYPAPFKGRKTSDDLQALVEETSTRNYGQFMVDSWFNAPPTAMLVMGDLAVEGFISNLVISETLFNQHLDPVRAEVDITLIEKIDSDLFAIESVNRLRRAADAAYSSSKPIR